MVGISISRATRWIASPRSIPGGVQTPLSGASRDSSCSCRGPDGCRLEQPIGSSQRSTMISPELHRRHRGNTLPTRSSSRIDFRTCGRRRFESSSVTGRTCTTGAGLNHRRRFEARPSPIRRCVQRDGVTARRCRYRRYSCRRQSRCVRARPGPSCRPRCVRAHIGSRVGKPALGVGAALAVGAARQRLRDRPARPRGDAAAVPRPHRGRRARRRAQSRPRRSTSRSSTPTAIRELGLDRVAEPRARSARTARWPCTRGRSRPRTVRRGPRRRRAWCAREVDDGRGARRRDRSRSREAKSSSARTSAARCANRGPATTSGSRCARARSRSFLAQGLRNRDIASALWVSENTVKTHLKSIFQKTSVTSRAEAIVRISHDASFSPRRDEHRACVRAREHDRLRR